MRAQVKSSTGRKDRQAEYLRKCRFAEEHEDAMLRRLHRAFTFEGTPYSADNAAKIAGRYAQETGLSFYEAVYELVILAARPWMGRAQVWGTRG
jgi:hypothetical protein